MLKGTIKSQITYGIGSKGIEKGALKSQITYWIGSNTGGNDGNLGGLRVRILVGGSISRGFQQVAKKAKSEHPDRQILVVICSKAGGNDGNLGEASGSDSSRGKHRLSQIGPG